MLDLSLLPHSTPLPRPRVPRICARKLVHAGLETAHRLGRTRWLLPARRMGEANMVGEQVGRGDQRRQAHSGGAGGT